ncbi:L-glutamate gamma-semialdehyde dehydrogenase [Frankia sp. AgB1.9]|uniref:L-glutamate gamma-semialdehyde dehydrogenase n=1 Tax=unclassified Frankia TaxID=2632575 RepID=UPI00193414AF|nr:MULTISPECIES: L-glutamate gamma-semialdehyde dehydrogenase [unclassified Frankia]MBL7493644.1 L-glutamate gamma-semialdehyde dehydrogenase [Frankia sp. AgW1.1]MBL7551265.1 L-glutamate gamma-semialdehyde dehydrogenase [Frankia sp. AgB1.9]MBL7621126.1 L-glutamate gamma-semialdehyde dehydrogenase [Frankia sp. AgB1.8]
MDAITTVPVPVNEPIRTYPAGSAARAALATRCDELAAGPTELTAAIGGERRPGGGPAVDVVMPHDHKHVLGAFHAATEDDTRSALDAARAAAPGWRALGVDGRAAVFLRAAELLAGPWRDTLNAATMLGQSKVAHEAEIDAACELIDFWRFNVAFARQILAEQPASSPGVWNRADYRPLEGFVYAITPFNFTSIAANLPTAPALMGNVVLWKPSPTQQLAAHFLMDLLEAAGLPPGVISMLPGDGRAVSAVALAEPDLAGIHFTGSTATFQQLWRQVGERIGQYRGYPRLVGETGGKDFVLAHPSADPAVLRTALLRGAFEYQGQKCSAASRAYVPRSVWERVRDDLAGATEALQQGDVLDPAVFLGALIDARSFARVTAALERARRVDSLTVLAGGQADDSRGWFVRPTVLVGSDPADEAFTTEYFGPVLAVHVYADSDYDRLVAGLAEPAAHRYALTGAVIAEDRAAAVAASEALRFAAGNFYVNDKPTGAVVGQQPFGGARASGTDDKAGSPLNLLRWTAPRALKENLRPPTDHRYKA